MSTDQQYYSNILKHSALIPGLYAKSKMMRNAMPNVPPASEDLEATIVHKKATSQKAMLCLGESTMAGVGVKSMYNGLPGQIAQHLSKYYQCNVSWWTLARVGISAQQLVELVSDSALPSTADIVVIAMGGNDSFYLTRPSTWINQLDTLINLLRQHYGPSVKVCFASFPPSDSFPSFGKYMRSFVGTQTAVLRRSLNDYCDQAGANISMVSTPVDFEEYVTRSDDAKKLDDLFCDGYHPSWVTYKIWAEDISSYIIRIYPSL